MAKTRKDAYKRLTHIAIVLAVLALIFGGAWFFLDSQSKSQLTSAQNAVEQTNSELVRQHSEAVAEYQATLATNSVVERPQPNGIGLEVVDLTGFALTSPRTVTVTRNELLEGGMLLLNRWHSLPSDFPEEHIVSILSVSKTIPVSGSSVRLFPVAIDAITEMLNAAAEDGFENYLIEEGYRTMAQQTENYQKEEAKYTSRLTGDALIEKVIQSVNYPGTSEYQSGFSFRIHKWRKDDSAFNAEKFEASGHSDWLLDNGWRYGIIFRFPVIGYPNTSVVDKSFKTGESKRLRIYRYVGKANAAVMHSMDFCMEEYIEYLAQHPHIAVYEDGVLKYEIVRTSGGDTTADVNVSVTSNCVSYTASTDNMGGIIVAMEY